MEYVIIGLLLVIAGILYFKNPAKLKVGKR
jgi:uncharacterized protein YjeT (DUF2065 family)